MNSNQCSSGATTSFSWKKVHNTKEHTSEAITNWTWQIVLDDMVYKEEQNSGSKKEDSGTSMVIYHVPWSSWCPVQPAVRPGKVLCRVEYTAAYSGVVRQLHRKWHGQVHRPLWWWCYVDVHSHNFQFVWSHWEAPVSWDNFTENDTVKFIAHSDDDAMWTSTPITSDLFDPTGRCRFIIWYLPIGWPPHAHLHGWFKVAAIALRKPVMLNGMAGFPFVVYLCAGTICHPSVERMENWRYHLGSSIQQFEWAKLFERHKSSLLSKSIAYFSSCDPRMMSNCALSKWTLPRPAIIISTITARSIYINRLSMLLNIKAKEHNNINAIWRGARFYCWSGLRLIATSEEFAEWSIVAHH